MSAKLQASDREVGSPVIHTPGLRATLLVVGVRQSDIAPGAPKSSMGAMEAIHGAYGARTGAVRRLSLDTTLKRAMATKLTPVCLTPQEHVSHGPRETSSGSRGKPTAACSRQ